MNFQINSLTLIDRDLYMVGDEIPIKLLPREARLLAALMRYPGEIVSRATLMKQVWETDYLGDTRTLDVHICWLRRKIEEDPTRPQIIVTHRGMGYRLNVPEIVH